MRKVKDITIISFEQEIERVSRSIQEFTSKIIDYDSTIPFRRMHKKQMQEKSKAILDSSSFFVSQKEFSDANKSTKSSTRNKYKVAEPIRNPLKSIDNAKGNFYRNFFNSFAYSK